MKRNFLLTVAIVALAFDGPAIASNLPIKAPIYKAPSPVTHSWTGFYAGLNVGYGWGHSSSTGTAADAATGAVLASGPATLDLGGAIGGGQVGYNYEVSNWVLGIEADIQGSGQKDDINAVCTGCGSGGADITFSADQKINWFGTVRGRLGAIVTPTILAYATGGLAYGKLTTEGTITGPTAGGPGSISLSTSDTKTGWVVGGGIEDAISGNWSAEIEYLYLDLGTVSGGPLDTSILGPLNNRLSVAFSSDITDNIIRVSINDRIP